MHRHRHVQWFATTLLGNSLKTSCYCRGQRKREWGRVSVLVGGVQKSNAIGKYEAGVKKTKLQNRQYRVKIARKRWNVWNIWITNRNAYRNRFWKTSMLILGFFFFFLIQNVCIATNCDVVPSAEKAAERAKTKLALFTLSWMHTQQQQLQQSLVVVMHEGKSNKRAITDEH